MRLNHRRTHLDPGIPRAHRVHGRLMASKGFPGKQSAGLRSVAKTGFPLTDDQILAVRAIVSAFPLDIQIYLALIGRSDAWCVS